MVINLNNYTAENPLNQSLEEETFHIYLVSLVLLYILYRVPQKYRNIWVYTSCDTLISYIYSLSGCILGTVVNYAEGDIRNARCTN